MLIHKDCKIALQKIESNFIDLIYLDPPFFTQKKQTLTNKNYKEYSFEDTWDSIHSYKKYIQERLEECKRVLKYSGSIFLHCDRSASHYLRLALDEVFGANQFQSEIIWFYRRWSNARKGLLNAHQVIFFYSKTRDFKFNVMYTDYSPATNVDQIFQKRIRDKNGKTIYKISEKGNAELMSEKKGVPFSDVWEIPYLNPKARERSGYPTQKPIILLERIIELTTNKGDIVLDPFCGSGTTLVAAQLLERQYIGIDQSEEAVQLSSERLKEPVRTESKVLKKGRQSYINQDSQTLEILNRLCVIPVQRNRGIDGFLKVDQSFKPIPVRIQKKGETLENAIKLLTRACQKNGYQKKVLIKTNDMLTDQLFLFKNKMDKDVIVVEDVDQFLSQRVKIVEGFNNELE